MTVGVRNGGYITASAPKEAGYFQNAVFHLQKKPNAKQRRILFINVVVKEIGSCVHWFSISRLTQLRKARVVDISPFALLSRIK
ncbi:hypothetical protein NUACC26_022180 [Scytonema sp. NUACC26]